MAVADPHLKLGEGGGGGVVSLALTAILPSAIFFFFRKIRRGEAGPPDPAPGCATEWFGEIEELKLFIDADLRISATWTYITNNGVFHTLKVEGISISFYPGAKTLNVQGFKSEIIEKKLLDIANTNAEGKDTTPVTDFANKLFETETRAREDNDKEGDETEIADKRSEDVDGKDDTTPINEG